MRRQRFLRDVAIMVFAAVMIKIFAFDFGVLSQGAKSAVFLILGIFLLLFAIIYPRVLKGLPVLPEWGRGATEVVERWLLSAAEISRNDERTRAVE